MSTNKWSIYNKINMNCNTSTKWILQIWRQKVLLGQYGTSLLGLKYLLYPVQVKSFTKYHPDP